jgi:hypothetical protein
MKHEHYGNFSVAVTATTETAFARFLVSELHIISRLELKIACLVTPFDGPDGKSRYMGSGSAGQILLNEVMNFAVRLGHCSGSRRRIVVARVVYCLFKDTELAGVRRIALKERLYMRR